MSLQFITCGESHGKYLAVIVEGMPSGLEIDLKTINHELWRRQQGYGRGARQKIEKDEVEILGGVVHGKTTGAPIGFLLTNKDFKIDKMPELFRPRPGHADLAGSLKYDQGIRPVLERASARETTMRVALGGLAKLFLKEFDVEVVSHIVRIGPVAVPEELLTIAEIKKRVAESGMNCAFPKTEKEMIKIIDQAIEKRDSLGGQFEVRASGLPIGLGSYVHWRRKLDGRIAQGLMSVQSFKAVEFGLGTKLGEIFGSEAQDEIFYSKEKGYYRKTDRAGGVEGGMTNGAELSVRVTMKPISTLRRPLASVNMKTKKSEQAEYERSDICVVPAGSVIGEAVVAYELADVFLEKFGGDSMGEVCRNYEGYLEQVRKS
ncbi:MAG: chorismate synthase [Candidatus Omnitrophica bacterium]|nr:chorismate synthase [Candidatus Omnitrophota bacterium]